MPIPIYGPIPSKKIQEEDETKSGRVYFSHADRDKLLSVYTKNKNPSPNLRQILADEMQVPVKKVRMWFGTMRQKEKRSLEKQDKIESLHHQAATFKNSASRQNESCENQNSTVKDNGNRKSELYELTKSTEMQM